MKKLKGDHMMMSWHEDQTPPEIGFDGKHFIIKVRLEKPVHTDWNCIKEKGPITCPEEVQLECSTKKGQAPCIVGWVNLENEK